VASETEFAFRHALVRDVAYAQIPRARRGRSHRRIAVWLESLGRPDDHAEMLAHHNLAALELSRATGEDVSDLVVRACGVLTDAGDRALALTAYSAAAGAYRAATELAEPGSLTRARLLLAAVRAEHMGDYSRGGPALVQAIEALTPHGAVEDVAEAELRLADIAWRAGGQRQMLEHLERGVALLRDAAPSPQKAYVKAEASRMLMLAARNAEAIELGHAALTMAQELGLDELTADALITIGTARVPYGETDGIDDIERGIELSRAGGFGRAVVRGAVNAAAILWLLGDVRRSARYIQVAREAATEIGHAEAMRWTRSEAAISAFLSGDWTEAEHLADAIIAEEGTRPDHYQDSMVRWARALMGVARGTLAEARSDADWQLGFARRAADPQVLLPALGCSARICYAAGEHVD
jgi:hypothetical protein